MNRNPETARTPQTFDEWFADNISDSGIAWEERYYRAAWDAALASQQAEIDRLHKEVEGHIELYVESNLRRERAEAELRAAREVVDEARKYVALVWDPHDPKAESGAFNRLKTLTDRLATSEDKG